MADEFKGKVYEMLSIIAIREFTSIVKQDEEIYWNQQPSSINVECDITVGKTSEAPRLLYLVTHTAAERASEKKFWRNMGEFVDARLAFGTSIRLISISFDSAQKRQLSVVSDLMFDGTLEVDKRPYGSLFLSYVDSLVKKYEKVEDTLENKLQLIRQDVIAGDYRDTLIEFAEELSSISEQLSNNSLSWFAAYRKMDTSRLKGRIPNAKMTYLRRGLGRCLPIETEEELLSILDSICKSSSIVNMPNYLLDLGLASQTINGYKITESYYKGKKRINNELFRLLDYFSSNQIVSLWRTQRNVSEQMILTRKEISSDCCSVYFDVVVRLFDQLTDPFTLSKALTECFEHPSHILNCSLPTVDDDWKPWLFDYIMVIIKAHTGKQQGYGYSRLVVDAGLAIPGKRSILDFVLPKYNNRTEMLDTYVLNHVSEALSMHLRAIGKIWIEQNRHLVNLFYLQGLFEDKIYKADAFDPILDLLNQFPEMEIVPRFPTLLSELLSSATSTCYVIKKKNTIIMWQSAYDANCGHKYNELVGRVGMLRVKMQNGSIEPRSEIKRTILIIDGTWSEKHIQCLYNAGFDCIIYADEIATLEDAII